MAEAHPEILIEVYCQECGYNLRGLTGDRCPECGFSLDAIRSTEPALPWLRRGQIGWFRAYWATIWTVMFRQRRFCDEMVRPVSYADAQWFRWVTVAHVVAPWAALIIAAYFASWRNMPADELTGALVRSAWFPVVLLVCLALFMAAATGIPSYFFHPKSIPLAVQNRAVAMSYYASGALAVSAIPAAAGLVSLLLLEPEGTWRLGLAIFAISFPAGQLVAWWLDLMHIAARTMRQRRRRVAALAVGVPILWYVLAFLCFVGISVIVLYVLLIVLTLS